MTKGNVGSLLVFDPEKITIDEPVKEASGDAVVGIVTERGMPNFSFLGLFQAASFDQAHFCDFLMMMLMCCHRLSNEGGGRRQELIRAACERHHDTTKQAHDCHTASKCCGCHENDD
jgi:hypothetical protein